MYQNGSDVAMSYGFSGTIEGTLELYEINDDGSLGEILMSGSVNYVRTDPLLFGTPVMDGEVDGPFEFLSIHFFDDYPQG